MCTISFLFCLKIPRVRKNCRLGCSEIRTPKLYRSIPTLGDGSFYVECFVVDVRAKPSHNFSEI